MLAPAFRKISATAAVPDGTHSTPGVYVPDAHTSGYGHGASAVTALRCMKTGMNSRATSLKTTENVSVETWEKFVRRAAAALAFGA